MMVISGFEWADGVVACARIQIGQSLLRRPD